MPVLELYCSGFLGLALVLGPYFVFIFLFLGLRAWGLGSRVRVQSPCFFFWGVSMFTNVLGFLRFRVCSVRGLELECSEVFRFWGLARGPWSLFCVRCFGAWGVGFLGVRNFEVPGFGFSARVCCLCVLNSVFDVF